MGDSCFWIHQTNNNKDWRGKKSWKMLTLVFFLLFLGTKHKTILEARSGLGPIKAYPRLGPKPSPEQGGELSSDPNTQERTFHCEICNVRVNSELQLKQVRKTPQNRP